MNIRAKGTVSLLIPPSRASRSQTNIRSQASTALLTTSPSPTGIEPCQKMTAKPMAIGANVFTGQVNLPRVITNPEMSPRNAVGRIDGRSPQRESCTDQAMAPSIHANRPSVTQSRSSMRCSNALTFNKRVGWGVGSACGSACAAVLKAQPPP